MERPLIPTIYVARIGPVLITAEEGSGRVDLSLTQERVRLDSVESAAVIRSFIEARRRAQKGA